MAELVNYIEFLLYNIVCSVLNLSSISCKLNAHILMGPACKDKITMYNINNITHLTGLQGLVIGAQNTSFIKQAVTLDNTLLVSLSKSVNTKVGDIITAKDRCHLLGKLEK